MHFHARVKKRPGLQTQIIGKRWQNGDKKNAGNCKSTNEKAKAKVYIKELKEENGKKRKSSDQNESNGNKHCKYEHVTPQGVNTPQTHFSAEQHM